MTHLSTTTRLLMAAAHLYPDDFKDDLKERSTHPFKYPAPEFGIDLAEIQHALDDAKLGHFAKSIFLFVVSYAALSLLIEAPTENWKFLFAALFLTSLAELVYLQSATRKARTLINNNHDPTTASCSPSSTDDFCERRETLYHWRAKNAAYGVEDAHDHAFYKKDVMISGGYSPFIGAGFDLDRWSFTIDLSEPEDKQQPVAGVTAIDLHDYIQEHLTTLHIDEMTISDELLVNGQDVNTLPHLLPDGPMSRPVDCVDKNYIVRKIASNDKKERHYRVVRIPMWDGQIFLSMYYRFLICNYNLFCEARFFLLPPLRDKYLQINNIPLKPTKRELVKHILRSVVIGAFSWIPAQSHTPAYIVDFMVEHEVPLSPIPAYFRGRRVRKWRREVQETRLYNYGWRSSLREKWSSLSYERYFQKVDKDFSLKLLTNGFLTGLLDCLSEKNISTEQFKQTTTKIINEGVMISGGEVKAETLAVGKGAKIAKTAISAASGGGARS